MRERQIPPPGPGEILVEVVACGVCRTDLHVVDGELPHPKLPIVPGHEIVGRVAAMGRDVRRLHARRARRRAVAGRDLRRLSVLPVRPGESVRRAALHRLYARRRLRDATRWRMRASVFRWPKTSMPRETAPLLCAGLIGWRSYRMAGAGRSARPLWLWRRRPHSGASRASGRAGASMPSRARATRPSQDFARSLGAVWAGGSDEMPPEPLDAAIIFAPVGALVPARSARGEERRPRRVRRHSHVGHSELSLSAALGGTPACLGGRISTRRDAHEFLAIAPRAGIKMQVTRYPLDRGEL